jgi:predicted acyltransferase
VWDPPGAAPAGGRLERTFLRFPPEIPSRRAHSTDPAHPSGGMPWESPEPTVMTTAVAPAPQPTALTPSPGGAGRLASVDALRGFDMFWILGGDALVHALHRACGDPATAVLAGQMDHCAWAGFHFYDLIFPLFVFIAGVSTVFSLTKTIARDGRAVAVRRVVRRGLILVALGIFCYGGIGGGWDHVRLLGVLQRIGLAYLVAGVLFCFLGWRGLGVVCASLLLGYWALMAWVPIRDIRLDRGELERRAAATGIHDERQLFDATTATVTGRYEPGYNLSDHLDFQYLPGRKWDRYYDPEGLLSTLPAVATCLLGVFAGLLLSRRDLPDRRKLAWLLGAGVAAVAVGWLWDLEFPVVKKLWTSSFVLVAGGWSALLLGAFFWLIDMRGWRGWAAPFTWIGMNAIAAYLVVDGGIVDVRGLARRFVGGPVASALDAHLAAGTGELAIAAGALALVVLLMWYLYRRQIHLRI